jgi:replicative DNA helicase
MNGLTDVAKQTMLPALVMCQLNREVEKRPDKRPNMADLRGSGEIEQDAALVGLLFRQGYYLPDPPYVDKLEISIAKNRDGAVGQANAEIIPSLSRIGPSMKPVAKADPEKFTEQKTEEHEPAPF